MAIVMMPMSKMTGMPMAAMDEGLHPDRTMIVAIGVSEMRTTDDMATPKMEVMASGTEAEVEALMTLTETDGDSPSGLSWRRHQQPDEEDQADQPRRGVLHLDFSLCQTSDTLSPASGTRRPRNRSTL